MSDETAAHQAPQFITTIEAARMAHCHPETVRRALRAGNLEGWLFLGQWRTTRGNVRKWVRSFGPGKARVTEIDP